MGPYDCVLCDGDYMRPLYQSSPPTRLIIDPLDVDNNDDKDDNDAVASTGVAVMTRDWIPRPTATRQAKIQSAPRGAADPSAAPTGPFWGKTSQEALYSI